MLEHKALVYNARFNLTPGEAQQTFIEVFDNTVSSFINPLTMLKVTMQSF